MRRRVSSSTGALTLVSAKSGIVSEASEMEAEREREREREAPHTRLGGPAGNPQGSVTSLRQTTEIQH